MHDVYVKRLKDLSNRERLAWQKLIFESELETDENVDALALAWEGDTLLATASRNRNILKLIAVDAWHQGEDLAAVVISAIRAEAFERGYHRLFLYTKPKNEYLFSSLLFYPVVKTDKALFMEDRKNGICDFLSGLSKEKRDGVIGAAVMNCNPFTKGHRYLIEAAARQCDYLYVFVLSEAKSEFSATDRREMVKKGTEHLENVCVLPTGPYLISSATFPTYFLKSTDNKDKVRCDVDIEIFSKYFAPHFNITKRFVGSEPFSLVTARYNEILKEELPKRGIELLEIERMEYCGKAISATDVRTAVKNNDINTLYALLPQTTIEYLKDKNFIK